MNTLMVIFLVTGGVALGIISTLLYLLSLLKSLDARLTIIVNKEKIDS